MTANPPQSAGKRCVIEGLFGGKRALTVEEPQSRDAVEGILKPVLRIVGDCQYRVWGLSPKERLARGFLRSGAEVDAKQAMPDRAVLVVGAEWVLHPSLVQNLTTSPNVLLVTEPTANGQQKVVAIHLEADGYTHRFELAHALVTNGAFDDTSAEALGLRILCPSELGSSYNKGLRKREVPYAISLNEMSARDIEKKMFNQSYKGVTDFVTKWFWPVPALRVTRWAANKGIKPNTVTTGSLILVIATTYLFAKGYFISGIMTAWLMALLDTVDGKLARVTMTYSQWGDIYDHGIDHIHPPFWWVAWWIGLGATQFDQFGPWLETAMVVIVAGYLVCRVIEGIFVFSFSIQIHMWQSVDSVFRLFSARRNPNVALLMIGALIGRPDIGFLMLAVWSVITFIFHAVRLIQALVMRARGRSITSWLAEA